MNPVELRLLVVRILMTASLPLLESSYLEGDPQAAKGGQEVTSIRSSLISPSVRPYQRLQQYPGTRHMCQVLIQGVLLILVGGGEVRGAPAGLEAELLV